MDDSHFWKLVLPLTLFQEWRWFFFRNRESGIEATAQFVESLGRPR